MPNVQTQKKDIESLREELKKTHQWIAYLRKNQDALNKRISKLEGPSVARQPEKKSSGSVWGIILIIVGGLLTLTIFAAIIGIPLLIWGIVLVNRAEKPALKIEPELHKTEPKVVEHRPIVKEIIPKKIEKTVPKRSTFEEDVGMKWFARIGILALVIGVGFFIKYAIDENWINHLTRIIMGVVFGIGLIIFGEIVSKKEKYINWGKTLVGGGFAITYFVIFAAYHFQEYQTTIGISQSLDIILLSVVVIFAVLFSVRDNSQIIAAESFFLGYVTSLLSNDFGFMTIVYGLLLTIGLVTVVSYKKWSVIGLGGVVASYIMYFLWSADNPDSFMYSSFILISYFAAFTIQSFFLIRKKEILAQNIIIILINSALFYFLYYTQIDDYYPEYAGLFTLCLSIIYLIGYYLSQTMGELKFATAHLYLALLYITLTIPVQLHSEWVTIFWAMETLVLTVMFLKLNNTTLRISSYIVGAITIFKTLFYDTIALDSLDFANLINSTRAFSFIVTIVCYYIIYRLLRDSELSSFETAIPKIYSCFATGFLVLIIFLELIVDHSLWVTILWAALLVVLILVSKKSILYYQSIAVSILLLLKVVLYDSYTLDALNMANLLSSTRLISFIITIGVFYLMYYLNRDAEYSIVPVLYSWFASGLLILIVIIELTENYPVWVTIVFSLLALLFMFIRKKEFHYQSLVVSGLLFLKVLFYDSWNLNDFNASDLLSSTRFFAFIIAILTLYIICWYLEKRKDRIEVSMLTNLYSYAGTILAFVLIVIEMEEFWISVGWSVLALIIMISGFTLRKKYLRIQGMIIFAITIMKVFLYDTRNLETLYRTLSYIVLGVILLLVSFIYTKYREKLKEIL